MRTNSRFSARAIDSPTDVLPVPEGRSGSGSPPTACRRRSRAPARSLRTARYSTMRSLTSSRPAWSASSTSRAWTGSSRSSERLPHGTGEQPVEVGADHRRLRRLVAHPLEPGDLALGLLAHRVGHARPRRSSCGTPRRRTRRPRRAPCGSTPSACAGRTRAAALRRPPRRRRGCAGAPAARRAARAGAATRAGAARRRRPSRAARSSARRSISGA